MELIVGRSCGGCTECCNGSSKLYGEVYGKQFHSGKPCHYVGETGCTIYENRPENPCVRFKCEWLNNPKMFPEWTKPNISKIIGIIKGDKNGNPVIVNNKPVIEIRECGRKIDSSILNYFFQYSLQNYMNISIEVDGYMHNYYFSESDYVDDVESHG